jgi:hypothetical protein
VSTYPAWVRLKHNGPTCGHGNSCVAHRPGPDDDLLTSRTNVRIVCHMPTVRCLDRGVKVDRRSCSTSDGSGSPPIWPQADALSVGFGGRRGPGLARQRPIPRLAATPHRSCRYTS